jgi:hypothetical protein
MNGAWVVFRKELLDALRDRRTLLMVLLSSVAMGPLVLVLLSTLVSDLSARRGARRWSWCRASSTRPRCATTSSARPGPSRLRRPTTSSS